MKLVNYKNIEEQQGNLLLAYGPSGIGKTATTLQTAEDPITYLTAEGRKIKTTLVAIARPELRMKVGIYEEFSDLIDTIMETKRFDGAKTIVLDSLTHLMVIHLAQEVLGENFEKQTEDSKKEILKELTLQVKLSVEAYGTLAGQMNRLMRGLQGLTMAGFNVICTARTEDRPKWNRALTCAPALMGKEFSKGMDGFFDFCCLLSPPDNNDNQLPDLMGASRAEVWKYHAPLASFQANDNYLAKWSGCWPPKGIVGRRFHVQRTFDEANGIFKHDREYFLDGTNQ